MTEEEKKIQITVQEKRLPRGERESVNCIGVGCVYVYVYIQYIL